MPDFTHAYNEIKLAIEAGFATIDEVIIAGLQHAYLLKCAHEQLAIKQAEIDAALNLAREHAALLTTARATQETLQGEIVAKDVALEEKQDQLESLEVAYKQQQTEIARLRGAAKQAMDFIDRLGENSPVVFGGEAVIYHALRVALGYEQTED